MTSKQAVYRLAEILVSSKRMNVWDARIEARKILGSKEFVERRKSKPPRKLLNTKQLKYDNYILDDNELAELQDMLNHE